MKIIYGAVYKPDNFTFTFSLAFNSESESVSKVNPLGNVTSMTAMFEVAVELSDTKLMQTERCKKFLLDFRFESESRLLAVAVHIVLIRQLKDAETVPSCGNFQVSHELR